jgi:hypothetical protein
MTWVTGILASTTVRPMWAAVAHVVASADAPAADEPELPS